MDLYTGLPAACYARETLLFVFLSSFFPPRTTVFLWGHRRCIRLIIFKTNSSVIGSKVSKGFLAKEVPGQAVGFGGGK